MFNTFVYFLSKEIFAKIFFVDFLSSIFSRIFFRVFFRGFSFECSLADFLSNILLRVFFQIMIYRTIKISIDGGFFWHLFNLKWKAVFFCGFFITFFSEIFFPMNLKENPPKNIQKKITEEYLSENILSEKIDKSIKAFIALSEDLSYSSVRKNPLQLILETKFE